VGLYEEPEKPNDPLVFLKQQLHGGLPEPVDAEMLRRENEELQKRNRELEAKVAELTAALAKHEGDTAQGDAA
jgi:cell division protein FtsB